MWSVILILILLFVFACLGNIAENIYQLKHPKPEAVLYTDPRTGKKTLFIDPVFYNEIKKLEEFPKDSLDIGIGYKYGMLGGIDIIRSDIMKFVT